VDEFENWITPKFAKFVTPKAPGDDAPFEAEETLVTNVEPPPFGVAAQ
jgi:hypothetical protein